MPRSKAMDVVHLSPTHRSAQTAILDGLNAHARNLTGDLHRDVDAFTSRTEPGTPPGLVFEGRWRGQLRFFAVLAISGPEGEIYLIATYGSTAIDPMNP